MARCGITAPHFTTTAHFVSTLRDDIAQVFPAVLTVCDGQGLIGCEMFTIDGVKLPRTASKHRSGTRAEFTQRAEKLETAAQTMLDRHRATDNRTDNESAKTATDRGVIKSYTGVRAVDAKHQIIVDAQAHGTSSEKGCYCRSSCRSRRCARVRRC